MFQMNARYALTIAASMAIVASASTPSQANWIDDKKEAAIKYVDEKKDDLIKEQAKDAIIALYAKLYRYGANRTLSRALAEVAIAAPDLEKLATETGDAYASGDEEKMRAASEKVAVKFGEQITRLASNPATRDQLGAIIGKADKVGEIAALAGAAAGSQEGRLEAEKFIGEQLIGLTPGAGVVGVFEAASGVMKYVNNKYTDSVLEGLYQQFASSDPGEREKALDKLRNEGVGIAYIINRKKEEIEKEKAAQIGDAAGAAGDKLRAFLTNTPTEEVVNGIIASFQDRLDKEHKDAELKDASAKAQIEADAILEQLDLAETAAHGANWHDMKLDLVKFLADVREKIKADGVLDPDIREHVELIAALEADGLAYGKNSPKYLADLQSIEAAKKGFLASTAANLCDLGSVTQRLAERLWSKGLQLTASGDAAGGAAMLNQSLHYCDDSVRSAQLASLSKPAPPVIPPSPPAEDPKVISTRNRLSALNYYKLKALLDYMNITAPAEFYRCLCAQIPHGTGVGFAYDPAGCKAKWGDKVCHFVGGWGDYCVDTPTGGDAFKACEAQAGIGYKSATDRGVPISQYIAQELAKPKR
ncbi:MAG: hypothetical protein ABR929_13245 [Roseiarcus sp.]|jgi:hypothetical protein